METARYLIIALSLASGPVRAGSAGDEVELEPVEVTGAVPGIPDSPGLETVQADTVELDGEAGTSWLTLEDVLESTPSVRVRSFGAPGSPSFLSIRGTDATHTLVLLDGVPLNDASTGFVDLSTVPVAALASATVIRGCHAAGAGPYHPGGVVLLASRDPMPGLHGGASLTLGLYPMEPGTGTELAFRPGAEAFRFGAERTLSVWESWFGGSFGILASGTFSSHEGDFAYLSDNGTVYNTADDLFVTRTNNAGEALSALVKLTWIPDLASQLTLSGVLHGARDGLPGLDVLPAAGSGLDRVRANVSLFYRRFRESLPTVPWLEVGALLRATRLEFHDPLAEIALARTDSVSGDVLGGLVMSARTPKSLGAVIGMTAEITIESWKSSDRLDPAAGGIEAVRLDIGLGTDISVPLGPAVLEASLRGDAIHDREGASSGTHLYLSPRAGLALAPLPWLRLTASVAYAHRPPTLTELFGNGGTFRGSAGLKPEHGVTADGGFSLATLERPGRSLHLELRAVAFASRVCDLIVFIQNSQKTMIAENVAEASLRGVEVTAEAAWRGWASIELGYTLLDPLDRSGIEPYDGLMLPNRPRHDIYLEATLGHFGVEISYLLDGIAGGYVDRVHLDPIATRTIHTLEVRWEPGFARGLSLDLKWWNVGNSLVDTSTIRSSTGESYERRRALADVDGYPLPGTAVFFTLAFRR